MEYKLNVAKETNQEVPTNAGGVTCPPMDQKDGRMDGHKRREQVAEVIWMRRTVRAFLPFIMAVLRNQSACIVLLIDTRSFIRRKDATGTVTGKECFSLHKSEQHVHQFTLFDYAVSIGELT
ncbi:uncharacterized protein LOC107272580 isoform X1 [Cephus cinctus]|uniref:Uncharacterized protein LOC107272580 isoform X1 n=1 Tax=Cephus cinctus TaxID=211228 RepID=A0AAJ7RRS4_CEPCN|nr:uncharacterized protein LOC107272580 isoform X1 [Cephus cinctus]